MLGRVTWAGPVNMDRILPALVGVLLTGPTDLSEGKAVVAFIRRQQGRMALHLRYPLQALTWFFDLAPLARFQLPFRFLGDAARRQHVERWRQSQVGPCRSLIQFYESLALFGLASMREVGAEADSQHCPG